MTHRNPSYCLILLAVLFALPYFATAQTATQRGVARMITRSATDPIHPVSGAQITIGNTTKKSDARGQFTLNITKNREGSFNLTDVKAPKGSSLILASPRLSDKFILNSGNLILAFTTETDKLEYYKNLYLKFYKKYNEERTKLKDLRVELKVKQLELEKTSAEYQCISARLDSVQTLLDTDFREDQEENVTKRLGELVEQLITTDYQSLEAKDAEIYDLMRAGDWVTLSDYLLKLMDGDPDTYMQEGVDIKNAGLREYALRVDRLKKLIESYRSQRLYTKAAHYYKTLIKADSTNWEHYNGAGVLAAFDMGDYSLGQKYFEKALNFAGTDTATASIYNNIGATYFATNDYNRAEKYTQKALGLQLALYGERHPDVATTYYKLGEIYDAQGNDIRANACHQKAYDITSFISKSYEQHFIVQRTDTICPISGVRILINGIMSEASDAAGRITVNVPVDKNRSFEIQYIQVPEGSGLVVLSPCRYTKLFVSESDIKIELENVEEQIRRRREELDSVIKAASKETLEAVPKFGLG